MNLNQSQINSYLTSVFTIFEKFLCGIKNLGVSVLICGINFLDRTVILEVIPQNVRKPFN